MDLKNSQWITTARDLGGVCPVFRKRFCAEKEILSATLEITALGVYEAELNGRRVGDFVLAPGWTSYDHRLQVQRTSCASPWGAAGSALPCRALRNRRISSAASISPAA